MSQEAGYTGVTLLEALASADHYNSALVDLIVAGLNGRKRLVDFGSGIGTFAKLLRQRGYEVSCVEADPDLKARLIEDGFGAVATLDEMPDESAQFVFSLNVLEHIENDQEILEQIYAKLEPGGRLLIYVPAFEILWTSLDDKVRHYRRYTRTGLITLAEKCGYKIRRALYVDSLGALAALLFKAIGNKEGEVSPRSIQFYDRFVFPVSRICDYCFRYLGGKNVYLLCEKPAEAKLG